MRLKTHRGGLVLLLVMVFALLAAACGDDDDDGGSAATTAAPEAEATTTAPADEPVATTAGSDESDATTTAAAEGGADMDALVSAATDEGKVTIYSSQSLDNLNAFGEAFKDKYGIDVEVVRGIDSELGTSVETEKSTGQITVDLYVASALPWVEDHASQGWFVAPEGPHVLGQEGDYDAANFIYDGNYFEVGTAVLTYGWNTDLYPAGLTGYEDLLDPELSGGKIGVIEPQTSSSIVDFYLWLEDTFGEEYVAALAAQEPRIYPSALPMGEATTSGEIYAGTFLAPAVLTPSMASGAPVDFGIDPAGAWGAKYFGMVIDGAPHPSAAQLLADFMVTPEGQELVMGVAGTVVPTESSLVLNSNVPTQDLSRLTPDAVAAYTEKWESLFR